ncbi:teratocarcinoma-derived growth factor-like [Spea bombifrons]|uniref:teratocarcinoma-derived growth factor-like n=1 Tax=Spea bombifrons TaxID=233779 RepID=UPI00234BFF58|nr:teratocarcinoma-derived growth factor-like [Spea bombifrons]
MTSGTGESCIGLHCHPEIILKPSNHSYMNHTLSQHNITDSIDHSKVNKKCCQNGGICFLGSFCICPPQFTGIRCELNKYQKSCGSIPHGEWIIHKCRFCRCVYGVLGCLNSAVGCDQDREDRQNYNEDGKAEHFQSSTGSSLQQNIIAFSLTFATTFAISKMCLSFMISLYFSHKQTS